MQFKTFFCYYMGTFKTKAYSLQLLNKQEYDAECAEVAWEEYGHVSREGGPVLLPVTQQITE